jgi:hypothetical protein
MPHAARLVFRIGFCFAVALGYVLISRTTEAQTPPPDLPRNLINPHLIPYEQGIANIEAQGAARPKAVRPVLPGTDVGRSNPSIFPVTDQPSPAASESSSKPH